MSSMLPGLEEYAETPFPAEYTPNFLTPAEADEFFNFFNTWHYCDYRLPQSGLIQKRKGVAFAIDPDHTQVRGTADAMLASGGAWATQTQPVKQAAGVMYGAMPTEAADDNCNDSVLRLTRDEK
ncbi:MAG: hypothetical protein WCC71_18620 [Candidatus Sulfotelmatobacter sp.]|jgi:hypothetical protein